MLERLRKAPLLIQLFGSSLLIFWATLLISGWLSFKTSSEVIKNAVTNHLESVASIQKSRVEEILDRYFEGASILVEAINLRLEKNVIKKEEIETLVRSYLQGMPDLDCVIVLDKQRNLLTKVEQTASGSPEKMEIIQQKETKARGLIELLGSSHGKDHRLFLHFKGPLNGKNGLEGEIRVVFRSDVLLKPTADYTGLGKTGEIILAERDRKGSAHFLTPLRFDPNTGLIRLVTKSMGDGAPILRALDQIESPCPLGIKDYRGHKVLCVNRYLSGIDWGIAVKMDEAEAFAPVTTLARQFILFGGLIFIFVVALSYWVFSAITRPLNKLSNTAMKIKQGDLSERADESHRGILGDLASSFNTMTDELLSTQEQLKYNLKELRDQQQRFEELADNIDELFWVRDAETQKVLYVNKAFERLFELPIETAYQNPLQFLEKVHPEDQKKIRQDWHEKQKAIKGTYDVEYRLLKNDGSIRWIRAHALPVKNGDSKIYRIIGTSQDITVLKETQLALKKNKKHLEKVNDELQRRGQELETSNADLAEFANVIAHDLKTPLRGISGFSQLLKENYLNKLDQEANGYIHFMLESTKRMNALIDGLLRYSISTRHDREFTSIEMGPLMQDVMVDLKAAILETGAKIHVSELPIYLLGDRVQLGVVFQNLIENALKYSKPNQTPEVWIDCKIQNESCLFTVKDNGIGIEESQLHRVFMIFKRLEVKPGVEGQGLGLATVKKIIERHHGGKIRVESKPGRGATFFFTIPSAQSKRKVA